MKANCVNVLNKTVSAVCKLENQVESNSLNIAFVKKYINFNKNLLLSIMGTSVKMDVSVLQYSIDSSLVNDTLNKQFIMGIINYLNTNVDENYYLLIESYSDIPLDFKNINIQVPSIIQISLVESNLSELPNLLDSVKKGEINKLGPVVDYLSNTNSDINSYSLAILRYLAASPEVYFSKESNVSIKGTNIGKTYEDLSEFRNVNNRRLSEILYRNIEIKNVLDTVNFYIKRGQEVVFSNFKDKSFNDPFYPHPTRDEYLNASVRIFLEEHNLEIDRNGNIFQYNAEPNQPGEPFEPSDVSSDYYTKILDVASITETQTKIENKIKLLLELTETETE